MRFIVFAIITLAVLLTLQPCQEIQAFAPAGSADASVVQLLGAEDCEDRDECSPFCICSCCSHLVSYHMPGATFEFVSNAETDTALISLYQRSHPETFRNTVWQPPKH